MAAVSHPRLRTLAAPGLLLLGAACLLSLPVATGLASRGGGAVTPGQSRPVLFYSPDCPVCRRALPLLPALLRRLRLPDPVRVDARLLSSLALRQRFDAAFRVPEGQQGELPALFHASGALVGADPWRRALQTHAPPPRGAPPSEDSRRPLGPAADLGLAGVSLLLMGRLLRPQGGWAARAGVLLLAGVLGSGGLLKVAQPGVLTPVLQHFSVPPSLGLWLAYLVGLAELGVAVLLLSPRGRRHGLRAALALLGAFSGVGLLLLASSYRGPCGCLPWHSQVGVSLLLRNAALLGLCWQVLIASRDAAGKDRVPFPLATASYAYPVRRRGH